MAKLMLKFGRASSPSISQSVLPTSLQSGMGIINEPSGQSSMGNIMQLATKMPEPASQSTPVNTSFGRTENVLSHFLQNPLLREEGVNLNEVVCIVSILQYLSHLLWKAFSTLFFGINSGIHYPWARSGAIISGSKVLFCLFYVYSECDYSIKVYHIFENSLSLLPILLASII